MLYTIVAEDVEDSLDKRLGARPAHLDRLHKLRDEGKLIVAGPNPLADSEDPGSAGFSGSVIIAEFDSLQTAQQWAEADPYLDAGVYKTVSVKPFKKVLP